MCVESMPGAAKTGATTAAVKSRLNRERKVMINRVAVSFGRAQGPRSQGGTLNRPKSGWVLRRCAAAACFFAASFAWAEPVALKTADGVVLAADYAPPAKGKPVFLLLHGLGAGKEEWHLFRSTLTARGYGSLALDLRGHGASKGPSYTTFQGAADWFKTDADIDAAAAFLKKRKIGANQIILAGASIGANLAARAAARRKESPFLILFSPGLNYQGVLLEPFVRSLGRPVIIAASRADQYSVNTVSAMTGWGAHPKSVLVMALKGHGAEMFKLAENKGFTRKLMNQIEGFVKTWAASGVPLKKGASPLKAQ